MLEMIVPPLQIGVVIEITLLCLPRIRWLHLTGDLNDPDLRPCGQVTLEDEEQALSLSPASVVIRCTKCRTRVRVAPADRPQLAEAYRSALDRRSALEQRRFGTIEFVPLPPVIVSAPVVVPRHVSEPRQPPKRKLTLAYSR